MAHRTLDDYRPIVGDAVVERIRAKAEPLRGMRVAHMNSTHFAGGVVEILLSLTALQGELGIKTDWRLLRGTPAFFEVTREMHDALQAGDITLTDDMKATYEQVFADNAIWNDLCHDFVYMHDHHTIGMVDHYDKQGPWIWRCHLDLTAPHPELIGYLARFADRFDAMVCILEEYKQERFNVPQFSVLPAIDPLGRKNCELSMDQVLARLDHYDIPIDRPIVTQISRFDRWKDPHGVVDAFEIASRDVDATLVLLGNRPSDDPEKNELLDRLLERRSDRVLILDGSDELLVAAMQQHATVVLQKSLREGFGLTVSEAMWKGTPVIGGNTGGIPQQIDHGVNGYLVDTVEQAAQRIVELVDDPDKAHEMGARGREKVRENFLVTRLLDQHLDLLASFDSAFVPTS
jgi:trehalose synthase